MEFKKYILSILFLLNLSLVIAQNTKVSGTIYQTEFGDTIPSFVSIFVKEDTTKVVAVTDVDGKFSFTTKQKISAIYIKGIGVVSKEWPVTEGKKQ